MIFFSSDQHFWHRNVLQYSNRPFQSIEEMNEVLVYNWNTIVSPDDTIYCLGDFSLAFRSVELYTSRLFGKKNLVLGNHDMAHSYHRRSRDPENRAKWIENYVNNGWIVLPEQTTLEHNGTTYNLCHHPYTFDNSSTPQAYDDKYANWRPVDNGNVLLCGHVHNSWKTKVSQKGTLMINVGVDVWDYHPVSMSEIENLIKSNTYQE